MISIIDPHIHLFDRSHGEYAWLKCLPTEHARKIARDFGPADIQLKAPFKLEALVHIEAGFDNERPWRELENIERKLATYAHSTISADASCNKPLELSPLSAKTHNQGLAPQRIALKSAGCIDLTERPAVFARTLTKLLNHRSLAALRHILDDDAVATLQHPNTLSNLAQLSNSKTCVRKQGIESGLLFELQMNVSDSHAVDALVGILYRLPNLEVVLNHAGFAPIGGGHANLGLLNKMQWQLNLARLSALPNLFIKCSGWEMTSNGQSTPSYNDSDLVSVIQHVIACFGAQRIMFASNFPLVRYEYEYQAYWMMMSRLARRCNLDVEQVCFENAKRIYNIAL
ncbi:amidohydrolase family protein [Glaciecola siphonariae]|uniref:Amidohydrolase family protein n=1 Tax=Glaciecola siphonariae TaxID=521012 RepID=A0ABV9LSS0_9ALTE